MLLTAFQLLLTVQQGLKEDQTGILSTFFKPLTLLSVSTKDQGSHHFCYQRNKPMRVHVWTRNRMHQSATVLVRCVPGSSTDDPPFWKSSRRRPWGRGWGIRYFFPVYKSGISRYMRGQYSWLRPGPHVSGYFWIRNFSFRLRLPSTRIRWIRQRIRIFLNRSPVWRVDGVKISTVKLNGDLPKWMDHV